MRVRSIVVLTVLLAVCHAFRGTTSAASRFLFVWAGDADKEESDFLAVIDVDPLSDAYASVVATLPVGAIGTRPHHTEHEMPPGGILWANGFDAGRTFLFDLRDATRPAMVTSFGDSGALSHPHSYVRLPGGNILATFQMRMEGGRVETGGLVEFDAAGRVLRTARADATAVDPAVRPYNLAVLPEIDRVVSTASDMHGHVRSRAIQVWRLSDLALLQTLLLPPGPRGDENWLTAEPRVLEDGRTVLVNTFTCGLYQVTGLTSDAASVIWVHSTPWQETEAKRYCAVPVVAGRFWIQTSGAEQAVISLDVSVPGQPREAGRLTLGPSDIPHWIALEPDGERLVITGYENIESRVLLARLDPRTGALRLDETFTSPGSSRPGVDFSRELWPHGTTGRAIPHGAVFSRR